MNINSYSNTHMHRTSSLLTGSPTDGTMLTKTTKLVRWDAMQRTWVTLMASVSTPLLDHPPVWLAPSAEKLKKAQWNCFIFPGGTGRVCDLFCTRYEEIEKRYMWNIVLLNHNFHTIQFPCTRIIFHHMCMIDARRTKSTYYIYL